VEPASPQVLAADAAGIGEAVALLAAGEIIAAPTDTVYGIAARLDRPDALQRLYLAKGRPEVKAIPILLGDKEAASALSADPQSFDALAHAFWPGALTIVTAAKTGLPPEVITVNDNGTLTVALRLPDSEVMRELCRRAGGALAVTSANASGEPPATSAAGVLSSSLPYLAAVVDGGETAGPLPSTIVSVASGRLQIIREGAIPADHVTTVWQQLAGQSEMRGMISG
jgi:L-threonylcarbamoyladenylate synthase